MAHPRPAVDLLRPCATSAGFTTPPEAQVRLDLARAKPLLAAAGFTLVMDARILLIVRGAGVESSVHDTGKVLLKTTDRAAAEAAYAAIAPVLEKARR